MSMGRERYLVVLIVKEQAIVCEPSLRGSPDAGGKIATSDKTSSPLHDRRQVVSPSRTRSQHSSLPESIRMSAVSQTSCRLGERNNSVLCKKLTDPSNVL